MTPMKKAAHLFVVAVCTVLLAVACQDDSGPSNATNEVTSGREPNASVSGSVTYRERIALTPGAKVVVELRDVSLADAAAPLIARQTISEPGQVPIKYKVEYNRDDIDSSRIYSVTARIVESDGRLAFTNDTVREIITRGNPNNVDMVLVLVQPPPDLTTEGQDWRTWVETPPPVLWANLIPNEREHLLRIAYYQSTIEGCARPGNQGLEVDGNDIVAHLTLMQPPQTAWAIPCDEEVVELDAVEHIRTPLEPGQTYRVLANGRETTTFSIPETRLGHTIIAESLIQSAELMVLEGDPLQYQLRVVSGLPSSGCSQFNGYEVRRGESTTMDVAITHHRIADPEVVCITDFPTVETLVPLGQGEDFQSGVEYTVTVNGENPTSFIAR